MVDASDKILSVSGLNVKLNEHLILRDVSFEIGRGDTLAVIGPNGAGKTVLLKALLGLVPYEGKIIWAPDVKIGYVPQKLSVSRDLPLTVMEFLRLKDLDDERVVEVLKSVGFLDKAEPSHNGARALASRLGDLSGGEFQRVLIAYALLGNPSVLLFDEPMSGVDIIGEETVYDLIHKLQIQKDLTVVFVSHELQIVNHHANNVLCLNREKISFGPPMKVVNRENLEKLYGEKISLHRHLVD